MFFKCEQPQKFAALQELPMAAFQKINEQSSQGIDFGKDQICRADAGCSYSVRYCRRFK
jgi:hypothetical protein